MRCEIFIHACFNSRGDGLKILDSQLKRILENKFLTEICQRINLIILGKVKVKVKAMPHQLSDKIYVVYTSPNMKEWEFPTINLIRKRAAEPDAPELILYLHTKGVRSPDGQEAYREDWRLMMEHFLVDHAEFCVDKLQTHETVGCNYSDPPHYSGNFWWAHSSYLKNNREIEATEDRNVAETWLLAPRPRPKTTHHYNIFASRVNHYNERFPLDRYKDKLDQGETITLLR